MFTTTRYLGRASLLGFAFLLWSFLPDLESFVTASNIRPHYSDQELYEIAQSFRAHERPEFTEHERRAAQLGRIWFFDRRFSHQNTMSCASCHIPERDFTDGLPTAVGSVGGGRNTPSVLNVFASNWFFWDGRAASLLAQVQGPIEALHEHGIDRGQVVSILWRDFREAYSEVFGAWPESLRKRLEANFPITARPRTEPLILSTSLAHYILATMNSTSLQNDWIRAGAKAGVGPHKYLAQNVYQPPKMSDEAVMGYSQLNSQEQVEMEMVFARFAWSIAQYERGLIALHSPFDQFLERVENHISQSPSLDVSKHWGEGFSAEQWEGLRVFVQSGCHACHHGAMLSDQQFHNIGLDLRGEKLDLGRALGIIEAKRDRFSCAKPEFLADMNTESCRELPFLAEDNRETVGAFKTPSLRNLRKTAPYMHDGRFPDLTSVVDFYSQLTEEPGVGHRDEILKALDLSSKEKAQLVSFLLSLSSPVQDLGHEKRHRLDKK